ncbi:MAG: IPT/TIG domain-containing protein [Pseudomonadota bacterium]
MARRDFRFWFVLCGACTAVECQASAESPFSRRSTGENGGAPGIVLPPGGAGAGNAPSTAPHAILSVDPAHGPFTGGTRVLVRGNGFASSARVWFGENEVPESDRLAIDPHRIQVTVPPGTAGLVDVIAQNGDDASTRVVLPAGYLYDPIVAEPASGPTAGGTEIVVRGQDTAWDEETRVTIDREPCEIVEVRDPTELVCRTPPGTPGAKAIRVTTGDGETVEVLDAFIYGDSDNGFRGGLSGGALSGELRVIVLNDITGDAVPGATVIVGADAEAVERTNAQGVAVVNGEAIGKTATVTVARRCFQPITFVDVPVDTVTVYLDPILSPDCFSGEGEIPSSGGRVTSISTISGELVWRGRQEFSRDGWTNVPLPLTETERHVAYVLRLASDPTAQLRLPTTSVTPDSSGTRGFSFFMTAPPGNYTLYALAGLEDRSVSPPAFTAYAMGLVRGVALPSKASVEDVFIDVDVPLDHALELEVAGPTQTKRGPDQIEATLAVRIGNEGYALLPNGRRSARLQAKQTLEFVGIPPLINSLSRQSYVIGARAVTGSAGVPRSVVALVGATNTNAPVELGPFLEVPVLETPARNTAWNGRDLVVGAAGAGPDPDLTLIDVAGLGGVQNWRIVAPGAPDAIRLPDLGAVDPSLAWPRGAQTFRVVRAQIAGFDYGELVYRHLGPAGWHAYAEDAFFATY